MQRRSSVVSRPCCCARVCVDPFPPGTSDLCLPACAVAHHVQKKATKKHQANRPKKSRPSDKYRTPPSYPPLPDVPWYTKIEDSKPEPAAAE